jgi:hypothetical protein
MAPVSAVRFDLRRAPFSAVTERDQHGQCVEMSRWADERGFSLVTVKNENRLERRKRTMVQTYQCTSTAQTRVKARGPSAEFGAVAPRSIAAKVNVVPFM